MNNLSHSLTLRLFKRSRVSPLVEGMASILDVANSETLYNYDKTPSEADKNSIHSDWLQVGRDLRGAMTEYASRKTV